VRSEATMFEFLTYPQVGPDDWQYTAQCAQARTLEMQFLPRAVLLDMANAPDFASAIASLSAGEYALPQGSTRFDDVQAILLEKRKAVREQFADWMLDERIVTLFQSRIDYANLRLALRRTLTDKPVGSNYCAEGNVAPELFEPVFEEESYHLFPAYLRDATEQSVLAYYQNKDVREIDYTIDRCEAEYQIASAKAIGHVFLINLFRMRIDLTNLRTMLRLKFRDADPRGAFLPDGFIELDRLRQAHEHAYEALGQLFFATPYSRLIEQGAGYVASHQSFLKIEQQCEEYMAGYLKSTSQVTAGPQPIIAFLLSKEQEIRTVRLILTSKKNNLDTKLILDRVS
jgi:V/A-type H+/Na+-transporting ATPase subunit C